MNSRKSPTIKIRIYEFQKKVFWGINALVSVNQLENNVISIVPYNEK